MGGAEKNSPMKVKYAQTSTDHMMGTGDYFAKWFAALKWGT